MEFVQYIFRPNLYRVFFVTCFVLVTYGISVGEQKNRPNTIGLNSSFPFPISVGMSGAYVKSRIEGKDHWKSS